jgi:hypothetical protein
VTQRHHRVQYPVETRAHRTSSASAWSRKTMNAYPTHGAFSFPFPSSFPSPFGLPLVLLALLPVVRFVPVLTSGGGTCLSCGCATPSWSVHPLLVASDASNRNPSVAALLAVLAVSESSKPTMSAACDTSMLLVVAPSDAGATGRAVLVMYAPSNGASARPPCFDPARYPLRVVYFTFSPCRGA